MKIEEKFTFKDKKYKKNVKFSETSNVSVCQCFVFEKPQLSVFVSVFWPKVPNVSVVSVCQYSGHPDNQVDALTSSCTKALSYKQIDFMIITKLLGKCQFWQKWVPQKMAKCHF